MTDRPTWPTHPMGWSSPRPIRVLGGASPHQTSVRVLTFTAAVFVLDLLTPLGIPYWLLYSVPFFFLRYNTPRHLPYLLAIVCTILILVGSAFSPRGSAESLTHRASAAVILWVVAIILVRRRP